MRKESGNGNREAGQVRLGGQFLIGIEQLRLGIAAIGRDGPESHVNNPDELDPALEIRRHLLGEVFVFVRRGEDLHRQDRHSFYDAIGIGITSQANPRFADENLAWRFRLGVEPGLERMSDLCF